MSDTQTVYAVTEFHNCYGEGTDDLTGTPVVAIYASRQTAQQHANRDGLSVTTMPVLTKMRSY